MTISKIKFFKILLSIFLITSFVSCDEGGDPDPGKTNTGQFAGDWFITLRDSNGDPIPGVDDNALHHTFNTAANDNSMWLADDQHGYYIKAKFYINENGQFFASNSQNFDDGGDNDTTVEIMDGQIIKNGAVSKGGHAVDRIYCKIHYSYDADGYDIIYEGHRRTGFLEDEY